jgi:hypothetical protein
VLASVLLSALVAQAAAQCADSPLQIVPPPDATPPTMPFGAPIPPAKTVISVVVGPDGHLIRENIFGSSGYSTLDLSAYSLVARSTFTAKRVDCKAVTAYQFFVVDFAQTPASVTPAALPTP